MPRPFSLARPVAWLRAMALPGVIWTILILCILPEVVLEGAGLDLWGSPRWRAIADAWGGFWPGLLIGWRPNYPGQPVAMFASYGFLHAGLMHLITNMITLVILGCPIVARIGQRRFAILYVLSLIGGGAGYALLAAGMVPMIGASGALFGLAGAWVAWEYVDRTSAAEGLRTALQVVALLAALNFIMWWAMNGQLAWQTHLGGFVTGWLAALLLDSRPQRRD